MSMLAEQKRRTKWVINPTKKPLWTTDSSGIKFGKQLMEKMGWSAGKGLGLNEQGIQEPLKVAFKNDNKGMGFKENLDDWIEHQDEFNVLLNQLRSMNDSSVKDSTYENTEIKSLEEKSKQSKARVHYQKFTRGKDLSKYSANDLACILGTCKTKKEKLKPDDLIKTETEVNSIYETSFGVTTINSGSIQDYFKKKWITDKVRSGNFASRDDDKLEESKEECNNENYCSSIHDEGIIKLEREEKKSRKRKHKSSYDCEVLCIEETKGSELDETENPKGVEKKRKKKEEMHTRKVSSEGDYVDENLPEKGHFVLEEVNSFSLEDEKSSNAVKKIKESKNHTKLEITNFEGASDKKRKGKKTKTDVLQEYLPAEKIHGTNNGDSTLEGESDKKKKKTLEGESDKKKKKKKDRKEKSKEIEVWYDNGDLSEVGPVKSKKRRRESEKMEEINNEDFFITQSITSSNHIKGSCLNVEETEKLMGTFDGEDTMDVKTQKKKNKKKDKKQKAEEFSDYDFYNNKEVPSNGKFELDDASIGKNSGASKRNDIPELVPGKKKNKNEKLDGNNEVRHEEHQCSQNEVSSLKEEFSEKIDFHYQRENISVMESVKKKKKKNKKDKSVELENKVEEESCFEEEMMVPFKEENTVNVEFVKAKKSKKDKKENFDENEGIENENAQLGQSKPVEEKSGGMKKETEKSGKRIIDSTVNLSKNYNNINNSNGGNTNAAAENRLEKLRASLFGDKASEKYFPKQHCNERVLKLIRWASISEFRGSNLMDLEGYGCQKVYEKQLR